MEPLLLFVEASTVQRHPHEATMEDRRHLRDYSQEEHLRCASLEHRMPRQHTTQVSGDGWMCMLSCGDCPCRGGRAERHSTGILSTIGQPIISGIGVLADTFRHVACAAIYFSLSFSLAWRSCRRK